MRRSSGKRGRAGWALILGALAAACVPPAGGWDPAPLFASEPALLEIPGQRLADLSPYPALSVPGHRLEDGQLLLLVCRYPGGSQVELTLEGEDWPETWARQALAGLEADRFGINLIGSAGPDERDGDVGDGGPGTRVVVRSIADPDAEAPAGLGDTLTLCDVSWREDRPGGREAAPRGVLLAGEIRVRRRIRRPDHRVHEATAAEWVATFLHELGHALGFAGHAAVGESIVHLEQSELRRLARRVLAGEVLAAPNLTALYRLAPGRVLGRVELQPAGRRELERLLGWVEARALEVDGVEGPLASVGDREARLAWRWPDGFALDFRLPRYVEQLRRGEPLSAELGPRSRRALERGWVGLD